MTSAVLLHPHPEMGGNQHNNVVSALHDAFAPAGITPHRFDFASSDPQVARDQTVAAIEAAEAPVFLVGYSFGGAVAATVDHPAIVGWCLIAPALTMIAASIGADPRPKYVLAAEEDTWFGPDVLRAATAAWTNTSQAVLGGTDHFFAGTAAERAAHLVLAHVQSLR